MKRKAEHTVANGIQLNLYDTTTSESGQVCVKPEPHMLIGQMEVNIFLLPVYYLFSKKKDVLKIYLKINVL